MSQTKNNIPYGVGLLTVKDGRVLCGIRKDGGQISGPGGFIKEGETPEEAAKREAFEKFGITPKKVLCIGASKGSGQFSPCMQFLCTDFEGKPAAIGDKIITASYVDINDILGGDMDVFPPFKDACCMLIDDLKSGKVNSSIDFSGKDDIIKMQDDDPVSGFTSTNNPEQKEQMNDGGKGSGNWGHAGRPGVPGGSAKGGGKAYRLTKPDGGFTGLGWAYKANAAFSKGGKEALTKALNVPPDTMSPKVGDKQEAGGDDRFSRDRKDKALWSSDKKAVHKELIGDAGEAWNKLTDAEKEAVVDYTNGSYIEMNKALYKGTYNDETCDVDTKYEIDNCTTALDKTSLSKDVWTERGTNLSKAASSLGIDEDRLEQAFHNSDVLAEIQRELIGTSKVQDGFLSTSPAKGASYADVQAVCFNLFLPKGSKAMYVEPISMYGSGQYSSGLYKGWDGKDHNPECNGEFEMIVQRGSSYRFTRIYVADNTLYIDADVTTPDLKDLHVTNDVPLF